LDLKPEQMLLMYLAGIPLLGILAQWLAWKFRFPSILLLLGFGILLGQFTTPEQLLAKVAAMDRSADDLSAEDPPAEPDPEMAARVGARLLLPIVALSVAIILFEGGMTLRVHELKQTGHVIFRLVTLGVVVSAVLTTVAAHLLFGLHWRTAALLGAILVVTGPTVIAPLLRQIQPSRRIGSIAKWEGIVIDPVGAVLAVLVFEVTLLAHGEAGFMAAVALLAEAAAVGAVLGALGAGLLILVLRQFWVPDFLHGVLFLTVALVTFVASNLLSHESGLITVTVAGVILANQKQAPVKHIIEFKEHLRVLLISCLFIVLGSRVNVQQIADLGWQGPVFVGLMIAIVRPASVYLSCLGSELNYRERTFLAFMAPRGIVAAAVTSVFALEVLQLAGARPELKSLAADAERLVPITFLVIMGTVAFYGLLAGPLARRLKLAQPNPQGVLFGGATYWVRETAKVLRDEGFQILLIDTNFRNVAAAKMEGLQAECASIISDYVHEEVDLAGIGRLLAVTPSDEVNTLACMEFSRIFGREGVYQLAPWNPNTPRRETASTHMRGRTLFGSQITHSELAYRLNNGAQIKKTSITEEFTYEQFRQMYGRSAIVMFRIISTGQKLVVCTAEESPPPEPGQTLIVLVGPLPEPTPEVEAAAREKDAQQEKADRDHQTEAGSATT